jgi:hypothetical protein
MVVVVYFPELCILACMHLEYLQRLARCTSKNLHACSWQKDRNLLPAAYFLSCTSSVIFFTTVNLGQSRSWQNQGLSSLAALLFVGLAASAADAAHRISTHTICFIVDTFSIRIDRREANVAYKLYRVQAIRKAWRRGIRAQLPLSLTDSINGSAPKTFSNDHSVLCGVARRSVFCLPKHQLFTAAVLTQFTLLLC